MLVEVIALIPEDVTYKENKPSPEQGQQPFRPEDFYGSPQQ